MNKLAGEPSCVPGSSTHDCWEDPGHRCGLEVNLVCCPPRNNAAELVAKAVGLQECEREPGLLLRDLEMKVK